MATKNLLDTIRKNTTEAVTAARPKADEDRKAHAPADAPSAPAKPSDDAALTAFRQQATTNLTKVPAKGTLDTTEPVDPSGYRVQATTRMPGETHKATTYKMDLRMIGMLDALSRKQNIAALISHLVARGLADVLREQAGKSTTSYHESYDSGDRNAFCGVTEPLLLAMVAFVEQNKHE
jgi:hypothetical protein